MTNLEKLNRRMIELEHNGDISEDEYATYKSILDWIDFSSAYIGDRIPIREARPLILKLRGDN